MHLTAALRCLSSVPSAAAGFLLATLSTNVAANVVAPVNALVNLRPDRITYGGACVTTALLGAVIRPWHLIASSDVRALGPLPQA